MNLACKNLVYCVSVWLCFLNLRTGAQSGTVELTQFPKSLQLYARNVKTNYARIEIAGKNHSLQPLFLRRYTNQVPDYTYALGQDTTFRFVDSIYAQLAMTRFELLDQHGVLIHSADSIVGGDFFLVNGQSNAEAARVDSSSSGYMSPFIRTYGSGNENGYSDQWYVCSGDGKRWTNGSIGQLALIFAHQYIHHQFVPVGIINGAEGGREIRYFLRNPQDTQAPDNFNRTLKRCRSAEAQNSIRAFVWYQGEQDAKNEMPGSEYFMLLQQLMDDYFSNYPGLEHCFMFQVRKGCSTPPDPIGEIQRAQLDLDAQEENIHLISSNYAEHDGCHFYLAGYRRLAERLIRQVSFFVNHDSSITNPVSPKIKSIGFQNDSTLLVTIQDAQLPLESDGEVARDFKIEWFDLHPYRVSAIGHKLVLYFNQPIPWAYQLTFTGHEGPAYPGIFDARKEGLLSFYEVPITNANVPPQPNTNDLSNQDLWNLRWLSETLLEVEYLGNQQPITLQMQVLDAGGIPLDQFKIKLNKIMHIPVDHLPTGIYFLKIQAGKITRVLPFSKR